MNASRHAARSHRGATAAAAAFAMSALLLGCSGSDAAAPEVLTPEAVAQRYNYDVDANEMTPTFALIPQYKDLKDGYARDLLARECLRGVFDYPAQPLEQVVGGIDQRTGQAVFTEAIAKIDGYPFLRSRDGVSADPLNSMTVTPEVQSAMADCGRKTDERLGLIPERAVNEIEGAGWQAVDVNDDVAASMRRWHECLVPAGVIDLPETPREMPSPSILALSGVVVPSGDGPVTDQPGTPEPSDREREVAVLDAQCRTSSGYTDAVLDARKRGELEAIARDTEGFEAARAAYIEYEKKLDQVIAELG